MRDNSFSSRILQPNYSLPINDHLSTYKQSKIKLTISNQWKKFSQRQIWQKHDHSKTRKINCLRVYWKRTNINARESNELQEAVMMKWSVKLISKYK